VALLVRREFPSLEMSHDTLSNAPGPTPAHRLAQMQAQRDMVNASG
jgi:hypothetical protein